MKKNIYIFLVIITLSYLLVRCNSHEQTEHSLNTRNIKKKYNDYVPDEITAKKVAEAIWLPIYGESVLHEKPYKASMVGDSVWVVEGVLEKGKSGGTAYIEIRSKDCAILKVIHGK